MSIFATEVDSGFELVFAPNSALVPKIRHLVGELAGKHDATGDWTSAIEMVTHELVENAIKGASKGKVRVRIEMKREANRELVEMRTWNRATGWNLACLQKAVSDVASATDPDAFYVELIRRTAGKSGSGLGIGRIRAEGGMDISCEVKGDEACVVVRGRRDGA